MRWATYRRSPGGERLRGARGGARRSRWPTCSRMTVATSSPSLRTRRTSRVLEPLVARRTSTTCGSSARADPLRRRGPAPASLASHLRKRGNGVKSHFRRGRRPRRGRWAENGSGRVSGASPEDRGWPHRGDARTLTPAARSSCSTEPDHRPALRRYRPAPRALRSLNAAGDSVSSSSTTWTSSRRGRLDHRPRARAEGREVVVPGRRRSWPLRGASHTGAALRAYGALAVPREWARVASPTTPRSHPKPEHNLKGVDVAIPRDRSP